MDSLLRKYATREESCERHGAFTATEYLRDRWSGCPACSEEAAAERRVAEERQKRLDVIETRLRRSGIIGGRFEECTFDNYAAALPAQQKVVEACRQFIAGLSVTGGSSLWLIGTPGTGKTHLGAAMVRSAIEDRDTGAALLSGREIVRMLRSTWGNRSTGRDFTGWSQTEDELIDDFGRIGLLVIGEVGASFGSESEQVQLFDVIDLRYRYRRPTVLLSNLGVKDVKGAVGDRSYDRLREGAQVLVCNWDSYRGAASKRKPLEAVK
jgi:DNA replication protein DnaC